MEDYDSEVEWAMTHGVDVNEHLAGLTTKPDIPLGPMTTTESRAIAHAFAVQREKKARELMDKAEAHYRECCNFWEDCCSDMYATAPEN